MICPNTARECVYDKTSAPCSLGTFCKNGIPNSVPTPPPSLIGWICPRCQTVHSPFIPQCGCQPPSINKATT